MYGQGDVHNRKATSIDEMKALVIQKGWSSFTITDSGTAYFKKFDFELTAAHTKKCNGIKTIWIYNAKGHKSSQQ